MIKHGPREPTRARRAPGAWSPHLSERSAMQRDLACAPARARACTWIHQRPGHLERTPELIGALRHDAPPAAGTQTPPPHTHPPPPAAAPPQSCWGCRFAPAVVQRLKFHSVLDAGCGNGELVRLLRRHGKNAFGVELSRAILEQESPDLLKQGIVVRARAHARRSVARRTRRGEEPNLGAPRGTDSVVTATPVPQEQGDLSNLPYDDNAFDLVFSADVLEHIMPSQADAVVRELVRVTRRHLVFSISLKVRRSPRASARRSAAGRRRAGGAAWR